MSGLSCSRAAYSQSVSRIKFAPTNHEAAQININSQKKKKQSIKSLSRDKIIGYLKLKIDNLYLEKIFLALTTYIILSILNKEISVHTYNI